MAITVLLDSEGISPALSDTLTISLAVSGSDRLLVVSCIAGANCTGMTYASVALTKAVEHSSNLSEIWYLIAPATGTNNLVITIVSTLSTVLASVVQLAGVHQTSPIRATASGTATGSAISSVSCSVTSETDDLIVDSIYLSDDDADVPTPVDGVGQTTINMVSEGGDYVTGQSYKAGAASSTSMSWSWPSSNHAGNAYLVSVSIKPAASGGGGSTARSVVIN